MVRVMNRIKVRVTVVLVTAVYCLFRHKMAFAPVRILAVPMTDVRSHRIRVRVRVGYCSSMIRSWALVVPPIYK